jgi:hypothetical protein
VRAYSTVQKQFKTSTCSEKISDGHIFVKDTVLDTLCHQVLKRGERKNENDLPPPNNYAHYFQSNQ